MRILHTSDWHLGRGFHGFSLQDEHQEMVHTVCSAVTEHQIDVVLISGDVYDRALPPEWAVELLASALQRITAAGAQVVLTSGNHDSGPRLGFGRGFMAAAGVHLRTGLEDAWTPVEFTDENSRVLVYGVPYLEPQLFAGPLGIQSAHHTAVMTEVLQRIHADAEQRGAQHADTRVVVMAHLFVAQGVASASERNIGATATAGEALDHHEDNVGGLAVVPLELFDGFDYTALGHLHGRQKLSDTVRYSGSPLRLSFSEADQVKGAWVYDTVTAEVTGLDWSIGRVVQRLQGELTEILDPETVDRYAEAYVQVKLTDAQRPERAFQRVQGAYEFLASFSYEGAGRTRSATTYSDRLQQARNDVDIISGFLDHVRQRGPSSQEQELIRQALDALRIGGSNGPAQEASHATS